MAPLDELHSLSTLKLTTIGRKSGQMRTVEVWFVVDDGAIVVQAGAQGQKGWLANVRSNPGVRLELAGRALEGRAEPMAESEHERVARLFRRKYWLARLARWVGSQIGRGKPVRIELTAE